MPSLQANETFSMQQREKMNKKTISKVLLISSSHLDYIIIGAEQFKLSDFLAVIYIAS